MLTEPARQEGAYSRNSSGERAALMLVHGWIGSSALWDLMLPLLSPAYLVLAPDLPGHGGAETPPDFSFTLDGFSSFIEEAARAAGASSLILVGHSMGGAIALHHAFRHPESVRRLVLMDTPYRSRSLAWPNRLPFLEAALRAVSPFWGERTYARFIKSSVCKPERLPEEFLRRAAARAFLVDRRALIATTYLVRHLDLSREAAGVKMPVLVIHGEQDRSVKASEARRLCGLLRDADLRLVPDCGHCPNYEYPELVVRMLEEWLDGA
ncbi:MAG: alpha/beta hydrolase [Actinomycetota bacterium]|nr:alpha/beta hydrolase [Actinomycetota bacterium]